MDSNYASWAGAGHGTAGADSASPEVVDVARGEWRRGFSLRPTAEEAVLWRTRPQHCAKEKL
jgi:hypothetical protein